MQNCHWPSQKQAETKKTRVVATLFTFRCNQIEQNAKTTIDFIVRVYNKPVHT